MNRRQFFGMSAIAVAAAGLPLIVLPERTLFLPPSGGWLQRPLRIREIQQYNIADDSFPIRYDAAWLSPDGGRLQYHVDLSPVSASELVDGISLEKYREQARLMLENVEAHHGFRRRDQIELPLPRHIHAKYV